MKSMLFETINHYRYLIWASVCLPLWTIALTSGFLMVENQQKPVPTEPLELSLGWANEGEQRSLEGSIDGYSSLLLEPPFPGKVLLDYQVYWESSPEDRLTSQTSFFGSTGRFDLFFSPPANPPNQLKDVLVMEITGAHLAEEDLKISGSDIKISPALYRLELVGRNNIRFFLSQLPSKADSLFPIHEMWMELEHESQQAEFVELTLKPEGFDFWVDGQREGEDYVMEIPAGSRKSSTIQVRQRIDGRRVNSRSVILRAVAVQSDSMISPSEYAIKFAEKPPAVVMIDQVSDQTTLLKSKPDQSVDFRISASNLEEPEFRITLSGSSNRLVLRGDGLMERDGIWRLPLTDNPVTIKVFPKPNSTGGEGTQDIKVTFSATGEKDIVKTVTLVDDSVPELELKTSAAILRSGNPVLLSASLLNMERLAENLDLGSIEISGPSGIVDLIEKGKMQIRSGDKFGRSELRLKEIPPPQPEGKNPVVRIKLPVPEGVVLKQQAPWEIIEGFACLDLEVECAIPQSKAVMIFLGSDRPSRIDPALQNFLANATAVEIYLASDAGLIPWNRDSQLSNISLGQGLDMAANLVKKIESANEIVSRLVLVWEGLPDDNSGLEQIMEELKETRLVRRSPFITDINDLDAFPPISFLWVGGREGVSNLKSFESLENGLRFGRELSPLDPLPVQKLIHSEEILRAIKELPGFDFDSSDE
jgi:hypothetical protein